MEADKLKNKKYKARAEPNTAVHTADAFQNPMSRSGIFMPNLLEATQYPLTRFTQNWQQINSLYRSHWVVRRVIDIVPADMMKAGYKLLSQLEPDQLKRITKVERQTRITAKILTGLQWGRLFGGAAGLILISGHEDILDQPLEYDQIMPGSFKGMLVVDRWSGVTPGIELITDISNPDFGMPEYYVITTDGVERGIKIHHSRICRFQGRDLPYLEKLAENYWGASELEHVFDELKKRDNVSWNMAMLTFMANIRTLKMEGMGQVLSTGNERILQDLYATVQAQNMLMNNNGVQILGENDDYQTHQYSFSGLGDVYDRFMMDLAGAAETPVTKLFGRSPAGMNATGESDMQNYYDTIEAKQESDLRPVYDKILPVMMMSEFGAIPDDFDYTFNSARKPKDDEMADLAAKNTDSVTKAFQAGLVSQQVGMKELRQQAEITGMWSNITDEDIENADSEVMRMDEGNTESDDFSDDEQQGSLTIDSDFKEEEHPRQPDGKFGNGSSSTSSYKNEENSLSDVSSYSEQTKMLMGKEYTGFTGQNAINKLLKEKNGHIKNAFTREDIGAIDLVWGNDKAGLKHIIKRRTEEGQDLDGLLKELPDIIKNGHLFMQKDGRFHIRLGERTAIIAPTIFNEKISWVFTAFEKYKK